MRDYCAVISIPLVQKIRQVTGSMSATPIDLFMFASSLATASAVGAQNVRAVQAHRRVPAGAWVYTGSNEKRDDVIVALAKRGVVLLGDPT
jgi:hypothetical protein